MLWCGRAAVRPVRGCVRYPAVLQQNVPIRQGQQAYRYLVMNLKVRPHIAYIHLPEVRAPRREGARKPWPDRALPGRQDEVAKRYGEGKLQPEMQGELPKLVRALARGWVGGSKLTGRSRGACS